MKRVCILLACLPVVLAACGNRNTHKPTEPPAEMPQTRTEQTVLSPAPADTLPVQFRDGKATLVIRKAAQQHINLAFDPGEYTHLDGHLTSPDSTANIRFTQIFMPDGSADGPFWNEIHYDLPQRGRYKLLIGENMMAGDPWGGVFTVELSLEL